jgi:L-lactate dehydrogenase complex protein LldG
VREAILERVRRALEGRARRPLPSPIVPPATSLEDGLSRFLESFRRQGGETVRLAGEPDARGWLERFAREFPNAAVAVGVPIPLRPALPAAPPESAALGVSMAVGAVVETGSVLLDAREGRRVQILPPVHLVWVPASVVHATLAEALLARRGDLPSALALHSGPSRSADIGQVLLTGVHGPGRVLAALLT